MRNYIHVQIVLPVYNGGEIVICSGAPHILLGLITINHDESLTLKKFYRRAFTLLNISGTLIHVLSG